MHKNLKLLFLLTIVSPFSLSGLANEEIEEEIVVVASRTPTLASEVIGSVTSISQADIELQMIDGLEQLVRFIPGVSSQKESQYGRALTEDVQIRGIQGGGIFLIDGVRISDSYVGYGRDTVDTDLLKNWGEKNDILVENTETIIFDGQRVSSTRIREELSNNNFKNAEKLLGRPYTFSGKVVHGQHLGRTINIPTANIWLPDQRLPIKGVYAVKCRLNNLNLNGIANMGVRPTVGGEKPVLEVHLFEFSENIYSQRLSVKFIEKIRDEKKFDNLDMLKSQIQEDISIAKNILFTSNES